MTRKYRLSRTVEQLQKHKEVRRKWRLLNRDKIKKHNRKCKYNITESAYQALMESQKGVCAICKNGQNKTLFVDHCHTTNRIRGLLCQKCNFGLGLFNDNKELLGAAIKYL